MKKTFKARLATIVAATLVIFGAGIYAPIASAETAESVETTTEITATTDDIVKDDNLVDNDEIVENKADITLDDILEFTGGLAEEAGIGDEWKAAMDKVKAAASEKKVDIMTALSAAQLVAFSAYVFGKLIYGAWKKHKDTSAEDVKKTKKAVGEQTKAVNELIGHAKTVGNNVAEASEREKQLAIAGLEQNAALRCLFNGVQLKQSIKDEALRHLNKSDACYDDAKK